MGKSAPLNVCPAPGVHWVLPIQIALWQAILKDPRLTQGDLGGPTMPFPVEDRTCYPDEGLPVGSLAHSKGTPP